MDLDFGYENLRSIKVGYLSQIFEKANFFLLCCLLPENANFQALRHPSHGNVIHFEFGNVHPGIWAFKFNSWFVSPEIFFSNVVQQHPFVVFEVFLW